MRSQTLLIIGALFVAVSSAHAQTTTADGVDAFLRGDYRGAAAILKPIAERSSQPDHVAEFFVATLYMNGLGVAEDSLRGCALYIRAMSDNMGAVGSEAAVLVNALRRSLSKDAFDECNWRAVVGFDHGFQPVTLVLGQGHWIAWDLKGATITYEGNERRLEMQLAMKGAVFLPIEHTELAVGPLRMTRRHFVDVFRWVPGADRDTWTLIWTLFEVVRDDLILITTQHPVTVAAKEPPSGASFDVRQIVRLVVNDNGDPEWVLFDGSNSRPTAIAAKEVR